MYVIHYIYIWICKENYLSFRVETTTKHRLSVTCSWRPQDCEAHPHSYPCTGPTRCGALAYLSCFRGAMTSQKSCALFLITRPERNTNPFSYQLTASCLKPCLSWIRKIVYLPHPSPRNLILWGVGSGPQSSYSSFVLCLVLFFSTLTKDAYRTAGVSEQSLASV